MTVGKDAPGSVHEQAAIDLRDCEETLEHMNNCLDKENERYVSVVCLRDIDTWKNDSEIDYREICY